MSKKKQAIRLRILTGVTVAVLACIIALQGYWLLTSYREQEARFTADIENALTAAVVKVQLNNAFDLVGGAESGLDTKELSELISKSISSIPRDELTRGHGNVVTIKVSDPDIKITDTQKLLRQLKKITDSATSVEMHHKLELPLSVTPKNMQTYQAAYRSELDKRAINIPFELALTDTTGRLYFATCDTALFKKIPVKSTYDASSLELTDQGAGLQAAFPDANMFLLRKMIWLLSVTVLLIAIGAFSLTYLLRTFFRQKRIADIRNDFMNNMTHELKTPISSVGVALEMVLDERHSMSEAKKKEYLSIAQGELSRLNMLVENVLKMSSFQRSEIRIHKEPVVALPWLQDIAKSLGPVLDSRHARLLINVRPELLVIGADKTHMTNVVQNLIENALKYNDKEVAEITIDIWQDTEGVLMNVDDNGMGIPAKYIDKVFDKFFRVPQGDRHDVKGYGLGLSYVRAVTELHGGRVLVSSIPGEGSCFTIYLPSLKTN